MATNQPELIAHHEDGPALVNSSAGADFTNQVIFNRIKYIASSRDNSRIQLLSSSSLALRRIDEIVRKDYLFNSWNRKANYVAVDTFTSFCWQMVGARTNLLEHKNLPPDVQLCDSETDRIDFLRAAFASDPELTEFIQASYNRTALFNDVLCLIAKCKQNCVAPESCSSYELFPKIFKAYNEQLAMAHAIDADDVLNISYHALLESPMARRVYHGAKDFPIVLEAQNLTFSQYRFVKMLFVGKFNNLMLVGDSSGRNFDSDYHDFMTKDFVADFAPAIYHLSKDDVPPPVKSDTVQPKITKLPAMRGLRIAPLNNFTQHSSKAPATLSKLKSAEPSQSASSSWPSTPSGKRDDDNK